ncbi:MAG: AI-2E family transporter [Pseudomonadota bacterium]
MNPQSDFSNIQFFRDWVRRILPNAQAVSLAIVLVVGFVAVYTLSDMLIPVFAAIVLAYLLEGIVTTFEKTLSRLISVVIVFAGFMAFLAYLIFALMPLLYQQTGQLIRQLPNMINRAQAEVMKLPELYPRFITEAQVYEMIAALRQELITYGQSLLSLTAAQVMSVITVIVYLILVPLLIFFFLKDKERIIHWFGQFLPRDRHLPTRVWMEVDMQIGNYVRGKFVEIFILWLASYVTFSLMGLNYSLLLGVFIGLSVIIPYVGATLVTFPVIIVAYFQWGVTDEFWYSVLAYSIIQAIDGVVLVPLLFSEAVNLHPVAIIVAILFFGGLWGFWGVFFAIPLATLVQAVLTAWPRIGEDNGKDVKEAKEETEPGGEPDRDAEQQALTVAPLGEGQQRPGPEQMDAH